MNVWLCQKWKTYYCDKDRRSGVRVDFSKNVNLDVKRAIKELLAWLRKEYTFPVRIRIYVAGSYYVKARDGDLVRDLFFWPENRDDEPYIKIATGDYEHWLKKIGKDNALSTILIALLKNLTHYFQWLNDKNLSLSTLKRQAKMCADEIMDDYAEIREHL